jgi:hypothetical protein
MTTRRSKKTKQPSKAPPNLDEILRKVYYDPAHESSFSSARKLYDAVCKEHTSVSLSQVKAWLSNQITYTLHKPKRRQFQRNPIVVSGIDKQWQADLVDMQHFAKNNDNYKYLLTVIDVFSKYAFAVPLKVKTGEVTAAALDKIFEKRRPDTLQTDKGREFENVAVREVLRNHSVAYFTTRNTEIKCAIVERFNKTLRGRMFRYFTANGSHRYVEILPTLVEAYNRSVHRSIGMAPVNVRQQHVAQIFRRLYKADNERALLRKRSKKKPKLAVGDSVRIPYENRPFDHGYYPTWTDEVYTIENANKDHKKDQYRLVDYENERVEGRFYPEELQKVGDVLFRVEKTLKTRTVAGVKQCFVKWVNFDSTHNSWVNEADIVDVS